MAGSWTGQRGAIDREVFQRRNIQLLDLRQRQIDPAQNRVAGSTPACAASRCMIRATKPDSAATDLTGRLSNSEEPQDIQQEIQTGCPGGRA